MALIRRCDLNGHTSPTPRPSTLAFCQTVPQPDGSVRPEPRMDQRNAANAVHYMASLPLGANVLQMTVMATNMPFVGRG